MRSGGFFLGNGGVFLLGFALGIGGFFLVLDFYQLLLNRVCCDELRVPLSPLPKGTRRCLLPLLLPPVHVVRSDSS